MISEPTQILRQPTPTLRLGVTGLARAGKTVFISALVRNLLREARLPFFLAAAQNRIERAFLEPQPDHDVPRFASAFLDAKSKGVDVDVAVLSNPDSSELGRFAVIID